MIEIKNYFEENKSEKIKWQESNETIINLTN